MIETILVKELGEPKGPFSQGKRASGCLFFSGQTGMDAEGKLVPGGVAAEAEQIMKNLSLLLQGAGASFEQAVDVTCFLTNMDDFGAFNEIYAKYFTSKPARTCVAVKALPFGASCEVRVTAYAD